MPPTMTATSGGLVPTPPNDSSYYLSGTGIWLPQKNFLEAYVNIENYGANSAASAATNNSALAAAIVTGSHVWIPSGNPASPKQFKLSGSFIPQQSQLIYSDPCYGHQAYTFGNTDSYPVILYQGTESWCFDLANSFSKLKGISIKQDSSRVPTAGGHVRCGNPGYVYPYIWTDWVVDQNLEDVFSIGGYDGFHLIGACARPTLRNCKTYACVHAGLRINIPQPAGDVHSINYRDDASLYGILIEQNDTSRFIGTTLKGCTNPLTINAIYSGTGNANGVTQQLFTNLDIESAINPVNIGTSGAYSVVHVRFSDMEINVCPSFNFGSKTKFCQVNGAQMISTPYTDAGQHNEIDHAVAGFGASYNTGISISGTDAIVSNNNFSGFGTGIAVSSTGLRHIVSGNNVNGCSVKVNIDATAKATGRGVGNIPNTITDW